MTDFFSKTMNTKTIRALIWHANAKLCSKFHFESEFAIWIRFDPIIAQVLLQVSQQQENDNPQTGAIMPLKKKMENILAKYLARCEQKIRNATLKNNFYYSFLVKFSS